MAGPPFSGVRWSGDRLGPYRIERQLGAGGMGTVYAATEDVLDRPVALKLIAPALADDASFRQRFTAEAQAQASLDSAHVVKVFAHGEIEGQLFLATQLVPDGDLGRLLLHGPPPPESALEVVAQVADGLAEAHRVGLVHRDIKPSNVLLRNRGDGWTAYLADFGIAHRTGAPSGEIVAGAPVGTPAYLAPELHRGVPPGPASDLYAVGCLLWSALTGAAPYVGASDHATARAHLEAPIPRLVGVAGLRGRQARGLDRLLRSLLAKDPDERVVDAAGVRDELRDLVDGRGPRRRRLRPR